MFSEGPRRPPEPPQPPPGVPWRRGNPGEGQGAGPDASRAGGAGQRAAAGGRMVAM